MHCAPSSVLTLSPLTVLYRYIPRAAPVHGEIIGQVGPPLPAHVLDICTLRAYTLNRTHLVVGLTRAGAPVGRAPRCHFREAFADVTLVVLRRGH